MSSMYREAVNIESIKYDLDQLARSLDRMQDKLRADADQLLRWESARGKLAHDLIIDTENGDPLTWANSLPQWVILAAVSAETRAHGNGGSGLIAAVVVLRALLSDRQGNVLTLRQCKDLAEVILDEERFE